MGIVTALAGTGTKRLVQRSGGTGRLGDVGMALGAKRTRLGLQQVVSIRGMGRVAGVALSTLEGCVQLCALPQVEHGLVAVEA